LAFDDGSKP